MNTFDQVHLVQFAVIVICPDCNCEVIVDSIAYKVRYIQNGHAVPAGLYVNLYGICPKCQDKVAVVNDHAITSATQYDFLPSEMGRVLECYARDFVRNLCEKSPDIKTAN